MEGQCVTDEEMREEILFDIALQTVSHARRLAGASEGVEPLSQKEWHSVIEDIKIVLDSHMACHGFDCVSPVDDISKYGYLPLANKKEY
tara:strand:+ start:237 stop:503 length:267 start_codon:yes stop_codon:yes gene_type:complete